MPGPTRRVQIADVSVAFPSPPSATFDYLADPGNRPRWQSSLRRIDDLHMVGEGPGEAGTAWTDVTAVPGISPRMEIVGSDAPRRWEEIGAWHLVDARLVLDFDGPSDGPTQVRARAWLTVPIVLAPALIAVRLIAPSALAADLRAAAKELGTKGDSAVR
ncbi:SRPBCC family protein [Gordonia sp. NPDC003424]